MMSIFSFLLGFISLSFVLHMPFHTAQLSNKMQLMCAEMSPKNSPYFYLNSALVCGTSLPVSNQKLLFQKAGLIHLIVVSGSHFQFILSLFNHCKKNFLFVRVRKKFFPRLNFLFPQLGLLIFGFMTGLQPPIVRSLLLLFFSHLNERFELRVSMGFLNLYAGLFSLALFPHFIESYSFWLSWICCVFLIWIPEQGAGLEALKRHWVISGLISLCLQQFNLIVIFLCGLLTWTIGAFLFPLGILAFIKPLYGFTDFIWEWLIRGMTILENKVGADFVPSLPSLDSLRYTTGVLILLQITIWMYTKRRQFLIVINK